MKKYITHSKEETQALAFKLGQSLQSGLTLLLVGDLGAGKTTFVQGLAKGLDIKDRVNSPTFVIMKEYQGRLPLVHIDAYRLEGIHQDLGFDDDFSDDSIIVIEWPQYYLKSLENQNVLTINRLDEETRELIFDFTHEDLLEDLQ